MHVLSLSAVNIIRRLLYPIDIYRLTLFVKKQFSLSLIYSDFVHVISYVLEVIAQLYTLPHQAIASKHSEISLIGKL